MKSYYLLAIVAALAVCWLQADFLRNLHLQYIEENTDEIGRELRVALDKELHLRTDKNHEGKPSERKKVYVKRLDNMTAKERDSLMRITSKGDTINLQQASAAGVGETVGDLFFQVLQDETIRDGKPIDLRVLDSLYAASTHGRFPHRLVLYEKGGKPLARQGTLRGKANSVTSPIYIGTKGLVYLQVESVIPASGFITHQSWVIALSTCLVMITLLCIGFQLVTIRRKDKLLKGREETINGTIHDLKSPLNSVVTMLSWFQTSETDKTRMEMLTMCEESTRRLVWRIESLLITVRGENARLILKKENTDVVGLAQKVRQEMDLIYAAKAHTINIKTQLPEGFMLAFDSIYVENVMRCLVDNALKYSDEGVVVDIALSLEGHALVVRVSDNGWGIPHKYLKKVFCQFFRVPRDENQAQRGYGIGLAQARYVIKAHGGKCGVESVEGKGSMFWFTLPLASNH